MSEDSRRWATAIVADLGASAEDATPEALLPLVYDELRRLARRYLSRERRGLTLEPTALVHEAYLRLIDQTRVDWRGRTHFFAVGAQAMRRILIDQARRRHRDKRGDGWQRVTLGAEIGGRGRELGLEELLALDEALVRLAELDPRQARIVELRFFGGLKVEEVAELLEVSKRTVEGQWTHARAWLRRELSRRSE